MIGLKTDEFSHAIYRMAIHEENRQPVYFDAQDQQEMGRAFRNAARRDTMLTGWFRINAENEARTPAQGGPDPLIRNTLYCDFGYHFVWRDNRWRVRQQAFNVITRMHSISPRRTELYHLRLLLLNVAGATSFQHLRTVNGVVHTSFRNAARALHLVENGQQWFDAMTEAVTFQMPYELRYIINFFSKIFYLKIFNFRNF